MMSLVLQAQSVGPTFSTIPQLFFQYPLSLVIQGALSFPEFFHLIFPTLPYLVITFGNNTHPPLEPTRRRVLEPYVIIEFKGVIILGIFVLLSLLGLEEVGCRNFWNKLNRSYLR